MHLYDKMEIHASLPFNMSVQSLYADNANDIELLT